jgi:UDP-N-acetylglucosamine diphosphorylase/glucosamine-1-phosphate N-acetyltransferase
MKFNKIAIYVLAAGLGKRMKSNKAKVLHEILGKPMVNYVLDTAVSLAGSNVYVIVGYQSDIVRYSIEKYYNVQFVQQSSQMGTGHAVSCALPFLNDEIEHVVILCGDTPLITRYTIEMLINTHLESQNDLTVLTVKMKNPIGYGRILFSNENQIEAIIEESDVSEIQRKINIVNTGIYCVEKSFLHEAIGTLTTDNAQQEMYLTDIVAIGFYKNKTINAVLVEDSNEMMGVNTREDLFHAEMLMQLKLSKNLDFNNLP